MLYAYSSGSGRADKVIRREQVKLCTEKKLAKRKHRKGLNIHHNRWLSVFLKYTYSRSISMEFHSAVF